MRREPLRLGLQHVGMALREPESFVLGEHEGRERQLVWLALAATATFGTVTYGLTMGIGDGAATMAQKSVLLTLAAGMAWLVPLPALYILNSLSGSKLTVQSTVLAALVTVSWGGLALVASTPINWFFSVAIPAQAPQLFSHATAERIVIGVNLLIFTGVGVSMADVFGRVMRVLEPERGATALWVLGLVAVVGCDLFYLFGLFV